VTKTLQRQLSLKLPLSSDRKEAVLFGLPTSNQYQRLDSVTTSIYPTAVSLKPDLPENKIVVFKVVDQNSTELRIEGNITLQSVSSDMNNLKLPLREYQSLANKQVAEYLKPSKCINGQDRQIKRLVEDNHLTSESLADTLKNTYKFVLSYLKYDHPIEGLYTYQQAIEMQAVDCGGFSTLLGSLLQAQGIPNRLVVGYLVKNSYLNSWLKWWPLSTLNESNLTMHAWLEVWVSGTEWLPLDASVEWRRRAGLTRRGGGFGQTEADRVVISFGCDFSYPDGQVTKTIDLVQHPVYLG
jgi:transglutaminase-like putative cysteine protease